MNNKNVSEQTKVNKRMKAIANKKQENITEKHINKRKEWHKGKIKQIN